MLTEFSQFVELAIFQMLKFKIFIKKSDFAGYLLLFFGINNKEYYLIIMDKHKLSSRITTREKEVIQLLAQGLTTKQIGHELNISSTTVITHRNNLRDKLECKNCPELIYKATQIGLLY